MISLIQNGKQVLTHVPWQRCSAESTMWPLHEFNAAGANFSRGKAWRTKYITFCTLCLLNAELRFKIFGAWHSILGFSIDILFCDINIPVWRNPPLKLFWGAWQICIPLYLMKVMSQQQPRTFPHKICFWKMVPWCVFDFCDRGGDQW